jgi:hypothetical protein
VKEEKSHLPFSKSCELKFREAWRDMNKETALLENQQKNNLCAKSPQARVFATARHRRGAPSPPIRAWRFGVTWEGLGVLPDPFDSRVSHAGAA